MGKYEPLGQFLKKQKRDRIRMSFKEIELLIGTKLPKSSKSHRAWWSNNPSNNVMTKEWLDAGFETESVEIDAERLVFRKLEKPKSATGKRDRKSIMGLLKGMITLPPDFNREEPFWELHKDWEDFEIGGLDRESDK
jgi:hypothetical protein